MNKKGKRNRQREGHVIPGQTINLSLSLAILMGRRGGGGGHFLILPLDLAATSLPLEASSGGPASVNSRTFKAMQDMGRKYVYSHTDTHKHTREAERCKERLQPKGLLRCVSEEIRDRST